MEYTVQISPITDESLSYQTGFSALSPARWHFLKKPHLSSLSILGTEPDNFSAQQPLL